LTKSGGYRAHRKKKKHNSREVGRPTIKINEKGGPDRGSRMAPTPI